MSILLSDAINVFFRILYLLIIVRVFMSWVPGAMFSSFGRLIYSLTDPVLGPVRRMMDSTAGSRRSMPPRVWARAGSFSRQRPIHQ